MALALLVRRAFQLNSRFIGAASQQGEHRHYLHGGGGDGGSLPEHEVDIQSLKEFLIVLSRDPLILSGKRHLES